MTQFKDIAEAALQNRFSTYVYKNERSKEAWTRSLDLYINPAIGTRELTTLGRMY